MLGLTVLFDPGRVIVSAGLALEATSSGEMRVVSVDPGSVVILAVSRGLDCLICCVLALTVF